MKQVSVQDTSITKEVTQALINDTETQSLQINVETKAGVVELTGSGSKAQEQRAVNVASEVQGVQAVNADFKAGGLYMYREDATGKSK